MHEGHNEVPLEEQTPEDRHLERDYAQYIEEVEEGEHMYLAMIIQKLLTEDEASIIQFLHDGDKRIIAAYVLQYKEVEAAFVAGMIDKHAPWYKDLENKLLSLSLYISHAISPEGLDQATTRFHQEMQDSFARKNPEWIEPVDDSETQ